MKFNQHGNLDGDIVCVSSLNEINEFLVKPFENSTTRKRNFDNFILFLKIIDTSLFTKIWIDGSFCSKKNDPNDIDLVFFTKMLTIEEYNYLRHLSDQREFFKISHNVDYYFLTDITLIPATEENLEVYKQTGERQKYWKQFFGADRKGNPKGIIEYKIERR